MKGYKYANKLFHSKDIKMILFKRFIDFISEREEKCTIYSKKQLDDLEKFGDRILDKFDIDIEFTKHFGERISDDRNDPCVRLTELQQLFKKIGKDKGNKIKRVKDHEAILLDIHADLNLPFVLEFKEGEFIVKLKTIMRKKRIQILK